MKIIPFPHIFHTLRYSKYTHKKNGHLKQNTLSTHFMKQVDLTPLLCVHFSTQLFFFKPPFPHANLDELATPLFPQPASPGFLQMWQNQKTPAVSASSDRNSYNASLTLWHSLWYFVLQVEHCTILSLGLNCSSHFPHSSDCLSNFLCFAWSFLCLTPVDDVLSPADSSLVTGSLPFPALLFLSRVGILLDSMFAATRGVDTLVSYIEITPIRILVYTAKFR